MRIIFFLLPIFLISAGKTRGQFASFVSSGKIEYEKKLNLYDEMNDWGSEGEGFSDLFKKTVPKFKYTYYDLSFEPSRTLFKPGRENPDNDKIQFMRDEPAETNIIATDLETGRSVSQKQVYGESFLIDDSLRRIKWKITDETRVIAGFNCRRANAIIMDSVYVVAFYTDEILTSGGPESFTGLPGMILGVALPHQHVSWFATKVQAVAVGGVELKAPAKGKKLTNAELLSRMKDSFKDWGKHGRRIILAMML